MPCLPRGRCAACCRACHLSPIVLCQCLPRTHSHYKRNPFRLSPQKHHLTPTSLPSGSRGSPTDRVTTVLSGSVSADRHGTSPWGSAGPSPSTRPALADEATRLTCGAALLCHHPVSFLSPSNASSICRRHHPASLSEDSAATEPAGIFPSREPIFSTLPTEL